MTSRTPGCFQICGALAWALLAFASPASARSEPRTLRIGALVLERCPRISAYCGHIDRPLDPAGAIPGSIGIHFEYYPHTAPGNSAGTLVATEGGPGYAATESRADYLALFEPLRRERDFVLMDNRGTGGSEAIDCPELQTAEKWTVELIGTCGRSLGPRAALYGTALAADDLAEILTRLGAGRIDLYGDSYGTYFEQVFALRHPGMLRSVVLDGAYPLGGPDYAWYPNYAPAMRAKFNLACGRSPACDAVTGSSIEHIQPVLERLRADPVSASAADSDGQERGFTASASQLATVMFAAAPALATTREIDAAARAFAAGDRAPLWRLMAETASGVDSRDPAANPAVWSAGLSAAVMCHDPPQIFDMRLDPEARIADRDRALADRRRAAPDTYLPFTIDEFRGMPLDYSYLDQCIEWPVAPTAQPASAVTALDAPSPDVPALVISGEFDDITTPADGAAVAAAFKRGRQVLIANSFHVNALPRPQPLRRRHRAPIHRNSGPGRYRLRGAGTAAAARAAFRPAHRGARAGAPACRQFGLRDRAARGDRGRHDRGRCVGALAQQLLRSRRGTARRELRDRHAPALYPRGVRWTSDLAISGTLERELEPPGAIAAHLWIDGPDGMAGRLKLRWQDETPDARAEIQGAIDGTRVAAEIAAP